MHRLRRYAFAAVLIITVLGAASFIYWQNTRPLTADVLEARIEGINSNLDVLRIEPDEASNGTELAEILIGFDCNPRIAGCQPSNEEFKQMSLEAVNGLAELYPDRMPIVAFAVRQGPVDWAVVAVMGCETGETYSSFDEIREYCRVTQLPFPLPMPAERINREG